MVVLRFFFLLSLIFSFLSLSMVDLTHLHYTFLFPSNCDCAFLIIVLASGETFEESFLEVLLMEDLLIFIG